jgi:hypothetical protein
MTVSSEVVMVVTSQDARAEILAHVDGLFRAFIRKDREAIRRGHTSDWRGFQLRSRHIVRGIDEYMAAADQVLDDARLVDYEILDSEVFVHGELAIVYYIANDIVEEPNGSRRTVPIRSIDIYRYENGHWNQSGSNISVVPE